MAKKSILLVEDDLDEVELTLRAFRKSRLADPIVVVRDGAGALDFLLGTGVQARRELYDCPQVILLDLNLPKIHGLEVLRRLRADARTRCIPVVILTSSLEDKDLIESYNLGANSYIRKPVNFDQFVKAVEQLHMYWLVLNEIPPNGLNGLSHDTVFHDPMPSIAGG